MLLAAGVPAAEQRSAAPRGVVKSLYGHMPDGVPVDLYTLTNAQGLEARVMTYGATLISVQVPDRHGQFANVTLYLDTLDDYVRGHPLFGSVVGRFANRIGGAKFTLDGVEYPLTPNARPNHIHGGRLGLQKMVWAAEPTQREGAAGVRLSHTSPDGHEGYPGQLALTVLYELTEDNELRLEYTARTDKPTHVNLTNHAYWNLAGAGSGVILDHVLTLHADEYLAVDAAKIPTGQRRSVRGTAMDFNTPHAIGARLDQVDQRNYDHCYVLNKPAGQRLTLVARVEEPKSGRVLEVLTTQPGVQLFSASILTDRYRAGGVTYGPYHGLCLETQHFPDAPNHPDFPSTILRPGQEYREITVFRFSVLP